MAIKIYSDPFMLFYNELFKRFQRLIPLNIFKKYSPDDYNQWSATRLQSDKLIFTSLFSPELTSPIYWYNKKSKVENSETGYCEVKPTVLIKALRFLKIKMPENFQTGNDVELKGKILFQLFLEKVDGGKELLLSHPDLIVFDFKSGRIIQSIGQDISKVIANPLVALDIETSIEKQLRKLTERYLNYINIRDYSSAWSLLSSMAKSREYSNDFNTFELSKQSTSSIFNVKTFNFRELDVKKHFFYEYREIQMVYSSVLYYERISEAFNVSIQEKYEKAIDIKFNTPIFRFKLLMELAQEWQLKGISSVHKELEKQIRHYYRYKYFDGDFTNWNGLVQTHKIFKVVHICVNEKWYIDSILPCVLNQPVSEELYFRYTL